MSTYRPADWYWIVAGSTTQVYSSARIAYMPVTDITYTSWLASGNRATRIATEQDLWDVLDADGIALPPGAVVSDTAKDRIIGQIDRATLKVLYRHENLVRELIRALRASSTAANTAATSAGLPATANSPDLTQVQFLVALKALL